MAGGGDVRRMKYESCQEIVAGKDYTRDEPLCDNTPSHPSQPAASSRYREEAREEKGGNPEFLLNIQTLRISHSSWQCKEGGCGDRPCHGIAEMQTQRD